MGDAITGSQRLKPTTRKRLLGPDPWKRWIVICSAVTATAAALAVAWSVMRAANEVYDTTQNQKKLQQKFIQHTEEAEIGFKAAVDIIQELKARVDVETAKAKARAETLSDHSDRIKYLERTRRR